MFVNDCALGILRHVESLVSTVTSTSRTVDPTSIRKELFRDGLMTFSGHGVERGAPILSLKIDFTPNCNELFRDGLMPIPGRVVERCAPIRCLKIDVTVCCQDLFRDDLMPFSVAM